MQYALTKARSVIGRGASCDILLSDSRVSEQHAEIVTDGVTYTVRDLGSMNGTWVNGLRLTGDCALQPGAQLLIGGIRLTFQMPSSGNVFGPGTRAMAEDEVRGILGQPQAAPLPVSSGAVALRSPIRGEVITTPREWQDQPPRDIGRLLIRLDVSLFFLGLLVGFIGFALSAGIVLICLGAAGLLFIIPLLLLPLQQLYAAIMHWLQDDRPVVIVNFQVHDESSGSLIDVRLIRKRGTAGAINLGDRVEVWGKLQGAAIQATRVHVYESQGLSTATTIPLHKPWSVWVGLIILVGLVLVLIYLASELGFT
ncbi:MAG TPA: FHA domain-containing protein [Anaerolineae bacterium]|nr:FHA domain-containing protein [Anaerolineae bacterium]